MERSHQDGISGLMRRAGELLPPPVLSRWARSPKTVSPARKGPSPRSGHSNLPSCEKYMLLQPPVCGICDCSPSGP